MIRILPYPWSFLLPYRSEGASFGPEDAPVAGDQNPETVTFFYSTEPEKPRFESRSKEPTVRLAEGAYLKAPRDAREKGGTLCQLPMPPEGGGEWQLVFGTETPVSLKLSGCLRCPRPSDNTESSEQSLRDTIDHLNGCFFEITHSDQHSESTTSTQGFVSGMVKIASWQMVWERWIKISNGEEPVTARIVEIARRHSMQLKDVSERPRRILIRKPELQRIDRVQELDAACLRDLIRRPGQSLAEKAGARQEIRAIVRRETVDTLENRVIRDFLHLCQRRASTYERDNANSSHKKVKDVRELRQLCLRLQKFSPVSEAAQLSGVPTPNYVLQQDSRYNPLWIQYNLLKREEAILDGLWPWARHLWADFVRALIVSFLSTQDQRSPWKPCSEIPAYARAEHQSGLFIPPLSVSSRWTHASASKSLFIVHPHHAHRCPGLETVLPSLGSDLTLVVYDDDSPQPVGLVCVHALMSLDTSSEQRSGVENSLCEALKAFSNNNRIKVYGLLLRADHTRTEHEIHHNMSLCCMTASAKSKSWFDTEKGFLSNLLSIFKKTSL